MSVDYEKLLRAYIRHVTTREGTDFLGENDSALLESEGLTTEEAKLLFKIGDEEYRSREK